MAPGSSAGYVDEVWDGWQNLNEEIISKTDHVTASENSIAVQLRTELEAVLDQLIERKVEDLRWPYQPTAMPLYWLVYRLADQIAVVIQPAPSLIHARK